ncbi:10095_t:CDS:2, partial [Cetraspora pellucida]
NIRNKAISDETKKLIYSVTKLNTQEEILNILEKIKKSDEPGTAAFTKMKADIWNQMPNNTNASESAHANINHDAKNKEPTSRSTSQKKRKNQALNGEKSEDLSLSSTSTLTMVPTTQKQDNYIEWENKKLELRQKNLEILKEEISLREKLNNLKQS